jgi:sugar/nucleoside kinase (ribokinase family)
MSNILVIGSVGYDNIETPTGKVENVLGGSANYFSLAASLYSRVRVVGVVGRDYTDEDLHLLKKRNVDTEGLKVEAGETFRWSGSYLQSYNEAITLKTELNVFQNFNPIIPSSYLNSEVVFLANIDPVLQMRVLDQVKNPKLVGLDTMNYWIDSKRADLIKVLSRIQILLVNEKEALKLSGEENIVKAVLKLSTWGPSTIVVKRGEYGFFMFSENKYFVMPAFPVAEVIDPTGAGDTFAGGFFGYLSQKIDQSKGALTFDDYKHACINGCVLASFSVEDFSVRRLVPLSKSDIEARLNAYLVVTTV